MAITLKMRNARVSISLVFEHKLSFLRGDSGSGKTAICNLIREYSKDGRGSGIHLSIEGCTEVQVLEGRHWYADAMSAFNTLFLVDEWEQFITSSDFADAVSQTTNYFVLITRKLDYRSLSQLRCNIAASYTLKCKRTHKNITDIWNVAEFPGMHYGEYDPLAATLFTEDKGSGNQLFQEIFKVLAVPADSNTKVAGCLKSCRPLQKVICVVDGVNILHHIDDIIFTAAITGIQLCVFYPQSTEWLLLQSKVFEGLQIKFPNTLTVYALEDEYLHILKEICDTNQIPGLYYDKGLRLHRAFITAENLCILKEILLGSSSSGKTSVFG